MQHFLLSAAARTLSLKEIYKGGEDAAYSTFCKFRWPLNDGKPVCPRCGCVDAYSIPTRRKFKCAGCYHQFSVTSGTIFASRKLAFVDMLAAICIVANATKGVSSLQLSRDLDVQYKTAFVFSHKLREAMASETQGHMLDGEVEVDGQYHGGHIRPSNYAANRVDRRLAIHQTGTRRVVIVAAIYLSGIWATMGYTMKNYNDCATSDDFLITLKKCGSGLEQVASLVWPVYWFVRSAKIVWSVRDNPTPINPFLK